MSFIKHRERMFLDKKRNIVRKRSDTNLRRITSCNDLRAWSLDADDQRQYFLDSITTKSSSLGKYIPCDVIVDILRKQNKSHLKKISSLKRSSSEEILKKKSKDTLVKKRSRVNIRETNEKNQTENATNSQNELELNNLRNLVKDMENRLESMRHLESENSKLKSMNLTACDKQLQVISKQESNPTTYKQNEDMEVEVAINSMQDECFKMRSDVEYLQSKNIQLKRKLKKTVSNERTLRNREFTVSMETVNNAILKSKVEFNENEIQRLLSMNDEQKLQIETLVYQIREMDMAFSWKQEILVGKLVEFKSLIKSGCEKVVRYERKLGLCFTVIREMEVLSDHYRRVNAMVRQNETRAKIRFKAMAMKALQMACKIQLLLREIAKRDKRIKELSQFPGRSNMAVRLTQLDEILEGDFLYQTNKFNVIETFERMKRILKELKRESWDEYGLEHPRPKDDNVTQTNLEVTDKSVQNTRTVYDIGFQTDFPDEFIKRFLAYNLIINALKFIFTKFKKSISIEKQFNDDLRDEIVKCNDDIKSKTIEIEIIKNCNKILHDKIKSLKISIEDINNNMSVITAHSELETNFREGLYEYFDNANKVRVDEYDRYCSLLERTIKNNEEKIDELTRFIQCELTEHKWQCKSYIYSLEEKYDLLDETLENECKINQVLRSEVNNLEMDIVERDELIDKIKDLWLEAELDRERLVAILEIKETISENSKKADLKEVEMMTDDLSSQIDEITTESIDAEVMTDDCYLTIDRESQIDTSSSCDSNRFRKYIISQLTEEKKLKRKLTKVNLKVKKVQVCIVKLRNTLEISVGALSKLKETNSQLVLTNGIIRSDLLKVKDKNNRLKETISKLKRHIRGATSKNSQLHNSQIKLVKDVRRTQAELDRVRELARKECSEESVNTELVMYDFQLSVQSKDECIHQLTIRIEKLIDLLKDLEAEKKYKEENMVCCGSQTDVDNTVKEKYAKLMEETRRSHENVIETLSKIHTEEKEKKESHYRKNLSLLKETYERDIKRIKKSSSDSLKKMQNFHEDEIKAMKIAQDEIKSKAELTFPLEKHRLELEQIRINYEKNIQEKTELFKKEKESIQEEMKKYKNEKETQVKEITRKMEINLKNMKKKCKLHLRKIKKENINSDKEIENNFNVKIDDDQSLDSNDLYYKSAEKEFQVMDDTTADSKILNDDGDDNSSLFHEAITDTSGIVEDDIFDSVLVDDRRILLKKIKQLEEQLTQNQTQSSENACDSEKRVWLERERCREVSQLLDREIELNKKLKQILNLERQKVEQLSSINETMANSLRTLQHRSDKNHLTSFKLYEKDNFLSHKYEELFDFQELFDSSESSSYNSSDIS